MSAQREWDGRATVTRFARYNRSANWQVHRDSFFRAPATHAGTFFSSEQSAKRIGLAGRAARQRPRIRRPQLNPHPCEVFESASVIAEHFGTEQRSNHRIAYRRRVGRYGRNRLHAVYLASYRPACSPLVAKNKHCLQTRAGFNHSLQQAMAKKGELLAIEVEQFPVLHGIQIPNNVPMVKN